MRSADHEGGITTGEEADMAAASRVVTSPLARHPRAGWAEDAKRIALTGDDALAWPAFRNTDDGALVW